jgi:hypothetical protein
LLKFAQLAAAAEDYEGAISAYERFLIVDADQPRVKFELGVLYYRLRSYEAARNYFEAARVSARAPAEVKERSTEFIADIDRRWGKSRFTGEFLGAMRYSDNPASMPTGTLTSFGTTVVPNPTFTRRSDWSVVGATALSHRYDFGRQDGGTMESDFSFYTARQFQVSEANVLLLDLTTGPRMELIDDAFSGLSLKPFMTGRYLAVAGQPTYWAWGAGLEASVPVGDKLRASASVLGRRRAYIDSVDVPTNSLNSGTEATGAFNLKAELSRSVELSVGANFTRYVAEVGFQSFSQGGFGSALAVRFTDPVGINGRKWYVTGNAGFQLAGYDQPDPTVDPDATRRQTDLNLGLLLAIPLDDRTTLVGQTTYFQRFASINNYSFNSFNGLIGIGWRF